jgi:lipopolysaccharide assembly protein A
MKLIFRIVAVILFTIFFGFSLKNTQEIALRFFLDYELRGPLVLMLLGFFGVGAILGILAMTPTLVRYRREVSRHKKTIVTMEKESDAQRLARIQPPQPDSVSSEPILR